MRAILFTKKKLLYMPKGKIPNHLNKFTYNKIPAKATNKINSNKINNKEYKSDLSDGNVLNKLIYNNESSKNYLDNLVRLEFSLKNELNSIIQLKIEERDNKVYFCQNWKPNYYKNSNLKYKNTTQNISKNDVVKLYNFSNSLKEEEGICDFKTSGTYNPVEKTAIFVINKDGDLKSFWGHPHRISSIAAENIPSAKNFKDGNYGFSIVGISNYEILGANQTGGVLLSPNPKKLERILNDAFNSCDLKNIKSGVSIPINHLTKTQLNYFDKKFIGAEKVQLNNYFNPSFNEIDSIIRTDLTNHFPNTWVQLVAYWNLFKQEGINHTQRNLYISNSPNCACNTIDSYSELCSIYTRNIDQYKKKLLISIKQHNPGCPYSEFDINCYNKGRIHDIEPSCSEAASRFLLETSKFHKTAIDDLKFSNNDLEQATGILYPSGVELFDEVLVKSIINFLLC